MAQKKQIKIGIFGIGVVGQGVVEQLRDNAQIITNRTGAELVVTKIVTKNVSKQRAVSLDGIALSDNPADILNDPEIDIVLELIGGIEEAEFCIQHGQ